MKKLSIIIACLTVMCCTTSIVTPKHFAIPQANQMMVLDNGDGQQAIMDIEGVIDDKSAAFAYKSLKELKEKNIHHVTIVLNSPGGSMEMGARIDQEIIEYQKWGGTVTTAVFKNSECASMCTVIFAYGDVRLAHPDSFWMFHSPSVAGYNKITEADIKEWVDKQINLGRQYLYVSYAMVDPEFAQWLKDNILWKMGVRYEASGTEVAKKAKTYLKLDETLTTD